jgi:hypothetical protein
VRSFFLFGSKIETEGLMRTKQAEFGNYWSFCNYFKQKENLKLADTNITPAPSFCSPGHLEAKKHKLGLMFVCAPVSQSISSLL